MILWHQFACLFSPLQKIIVKITILLFKLVGCSDCYGFTHANAIATLYYLVEGV